MTSFGPGLLAIDAEAEATFIAETLRGQVVGLRRRGVVVGLSGGVDSALCAALAVRALGPQRVVAVLMPDRDTPAAATERARRYARQLGVETVVVDIDASLEALGSHRRRDEAVRQVFPGLPDGYRTKIVLADGVMERDRVPYFNLVVDAGDGLQQTRRMPVGPYLQVVAATNMKQRVRTLLLYTIAESRDHAVLGTPNRLEYALGFFVRGGDGLADLKPIAHLYKSQVFALAAHLRVDEEIRASRPSTDTYSLFQSQEEFYFGVSLDQADLLLYGLEHGVPADEIAAGIGLVAEQVNRALVEIGGKRRVAARLSGPPLLVRPVPGAG